MIAKPIPKIVRINPAILKRAEALGFENLNFHVNQWLKNWIEMRLEADRSVKHKILDI